MKQSFSQFLQLCMLLLLKCMGRKEILELDVVGAEIFVAESANGNKNTLLHSQCTVLHSSVNAFEFLSNSSDFLLHDFPPLFPEIQQNTDATGRRGAISWRKILASLQRLALGSSFDSLDDQARMSAESIRQAFRAFWQTVRVHYGPEFLDREPSLTEIRALERSFASKSFPGCIGSVDCMSISWKNCPK